MRNRIFSSAIVIAGGLFATTALANTGESGMHKGQKVSFEQVDQNGDGYISQNEFQSSGAFQVDHDKLDTDRDGRVNQSEFAAFERTGQEGMDQQGQWQQGQGQQGQGQQDQQQYEYEQGQGFEDQSDFSTDPTEDPVQDDY